MIQLQQLSGRKAGKRRERQWLLATLLLADLLAQPWVLPARSQQEKLSPGNNAQTTQTQEKQGEDIPADVEGWFEAAKTAYSSGNPAEALRWQAKVLAWLSQHSGYDALRARAHLNQGQFLGTLGRTKEAIAHEQESVKILAESSKVNPMLLGDLASALDNLGISYSKIGRQKEGLESMIVSVQIRRELTKKNQAHLSDLARGLNNLGTIYSRLGRKQEALEPTLESVQIRRELAKTNQAYLGDLAWALDSLCISYRELDRWQEALEPTLESVQIRRELAKTNPVNLGHLARSLDNLGSIYSGLGWRQEALAPTLESVQIYRQLSKEKPAYLGDLANALNNLRVSYRDLGRLQEALEPTLESLQIYRQLSKINPAHLGDLANALNNLGVSYRELGRWQESLMPTLESLQIYRQLSKINQAHLGDLASVLNNLGVGYSNLGRWQEALEPTLESLQIYRQLSKINQAYLGDLAGALNDLGVSYGKLGRWQEALEPTLESLQIYRQITKTNSAYLDNLATALVTLGVNYSNLGRRQEVLAPTLESLQIRRELAKSNPAYLPGLARALNNLGVSYSDLGRWQEALEPTLESLQIYRQLAKVNAAYLGDLAGVLNNLGGAYSELGRRQQALEMTLESLQIRRVLTKTNPNYLGGLAGVLGNLGIRYSELGRRQQALEPTLESLQIYRQLSKINPAYLGDLAGALLNLGKFYGDMSGRQEVLRLTLQSVQIYRQLANTNPKYLEDLAMATANLALANLEVNNAPAIPSLLKESLTCETVYLRSQLPLLPEARRQAMLDKFGSRWQIPFSVALQGSAGAEVALFARLNRHGLLLDIQRQQALLARDGGHRAAFDQLQALDARLTAGTLSQSQQQALLGQKEQLEQTLWKQLGVDQRLVSIADVQHVIPAGGALLEVQRYQPYQPATNQRGAARYLALLLKPNGSIRAIPLGEATAIDAAVARVITTSSGRFADADDALQAASQVVLRPLLADLAGVEQLFISPDGELNRLPFAALPMPDAPSRLFADSFKLRLLTSGRDLLRLQQPSRPSGPAAMVANPDFGSAAPWQPLPHTAEEAALLAPLLQVQRPLTGADASTPNVLATASPRILHIASHGFFWSPEQAHDMARQRAASCGTPDTTPATPAAMQRSGIVLAGANKPCRTGPDDGYLTAAEVTGMDLDGTELTTLSACQTGLGDVRTGEGVYGLQRALAVAGSRSALLSLWKVDDAATREFMATFYGHLRQGLGRADALAATQDAFRRHPNPDYHHVYYWGAFQLTGDWRPLPRW